MRWDSSQFVWSCSSLRFKCCSVEFPRLTQETAAITFSLYPCGWVVWDLSCVYNPYTFSLSVSISRSNLPAWSSAESVTSAESDFLACSLLQFIPRDVPPERRWWQKCWGKNFTTNLRPVRSTGEKKSHCHIQLLRWNHYRELSETLEREKREREENRWKRQRDTSKRNEDRTRRRRQEPWGEDSIELLIQLGNERWKHSVGFRWEEEPGYGAKKLNERREWALVGWVPPSFPFSDGEVLCFTTKSSKWKRPRQRWKPTAEISNPTGVALTSVGSDKLNLWEELSSW